MLGAVLLDERHLNALLIEEQLRPEHFFREQYGAVFAAMLELYNGDRKIDHLTVAETLRQHGKLEEIGGPEAIDELAGWVPAAGHARDYARIVRENAQMRALLNTSYEIQASVLVPRGAGARPGRAGRARGAGGGARRSPEEDPADRRDPRRGDRAAAQAVGRALAADRDAVGLQGPRRQDRRLSAAAT